MHLKMLLRLLIGKVRVVTEYLLSTYYMPYIG
jgi:hypothetical protein